MLPHQEFIYHDKESAIVAVKLAIAAESEMNALFVNSKIVYMDYEVLCHCKKSLSGIRGVCVLENKPYAAIRGFCVKCGESYYPNETFVLKFNQSNK